MIEPIQYVRTDPDGSMRVGDTRVLLEVVVGRSCKEIRRKQSRAAFGLKASNRRTGQSLTICSIRKKLTTTSPSVIKKRRKFASGSKQSEPSRPSLANCWKSVCATVKARPYESA